MGFLLPLLPLPWIFSVINKCWFHCTCILKFMVHFTKVMVFGQFHYFLNKCILLSTCPYCISPCLFVECLCMGSNKDYFELWIWLPMHWVAITLKMHTLYAMVIGERKISTKTHSRIANTFGSTSVRHWTDTSTSDHCVIDVNMKVFAIWVIPMCKNDMKMHLHTDTILHIMFCLTMPWIHRSPGN